MRSSLYAKLSENLSKNIRNFLKKEDLNNAELARLSNIPHSTIYGISSGNSVNPSLYTLADIAAFLKINVSQLIGELPLNLMQIAIPMISWSDINAETSSVDINITNETKFISCPIYSTGSVYLSVEILK
jgi:transcriptional regulator with XRE-family HTH domain